MDYTLFLKVINLHKLDVNQLYYINYIKIKFTAIYLPKKKIIKW